MPHLDKGKLTPLTGHRWSPSVSDGAVNVFEACTLSAAWPQSISQMLSVSLDEMIKNK